MLDRIRNIVDAMGIRRSIYHNTAISEIISQVAQSDFLFRLEQEFRILMKRSDFDHFSSVRSIEDFIEKVMFFRQGGSSYENHIFNGDAIGIVANAK